jgi:enterochelin esterase-like enzyme
MTSAVLGWSALTGAVPTTLTVLGAAGLVALIARRDPAWWTRHVPRAVLLALLVPVATAIVVDRVWRPFPDRLPVDALVYLGVAVLALALLVLRLRPPGKRSRAGAVLRVLGLGLAAAAVVVAAASGVNRYYGQFPTVGAALDVPLANQADLADLAPADGVVAAPGGVPLQRMWTAPSGMPEHGRIAEVPVPGVRSGFVARPALVYLPPAYLATTRPELPVLVLLGGQPGSPRDWFDGGRLAQRMDVYAAAHAGLAPVVVVTDQLGSAMANPLCLDSPLGNVATYTDVDVPAWIRGRLHVDPAPRSWAVGGFSSGGTCALQASVRSPAVYPTFVDISGQDEPSLGSRAHTVQRVFAGDDAAFRAANPLDQVVRAHPDIAGMLIAGDRDTKYRPQAEHVRRALLGAGVPVEFALLPGGHTWNVWGPGLDAALPWLGTRIGLTP